jgi:ribosomal-protein-alanine N-acetyltransferase
VSTTRGIDIQPLALDDVTAIEQIEQRSMPAPWSRMMFVSEIVKATSVCLGAFVDDALVAYVIVSRYVDAWHVMNLVVAPEHRREGIATRLLAALFDRTAEDDRRGFTLEVRLSNAPAIELYESMGFRAQGVRRAYYTDNREDALIMWREPVDRDSVAID